MLPDKLKMKFLRHSGATVLGENGATEDQISAVTGHKSRTMLNIYVKKTKRLASSAQQLRFKENEKHYWGKKGVWERIAKADQQATKRPDWKINRSNTGNNNWT